MPDKNINENQDTMKFKVPKQAGYTRVYKTDDIESAKRRAAQSEANRTAGQQQTSENTHKKHRSSGGSGRSSSGTAENQRNTARTSAPSADRNNAPQRKRPAPVQSGGSSSGSARTPGTGNHTAAAVRKNNRKGAAAVIKILVIVIISLFLIYSAAALYYITRINPIQNSGSYVNDPETLLYSSNIKNILIIGEDARDASTRGLSDSMILLSVNNTKHRLQMTSFMRDIYVDIDEHDSDKLNAAYSYGGAELLKDTIEDNFKIRIDGCVTVNFIAVAHLVDAVGGVQVTVSADEANAVNEILYNEVNEIMGDDKYDDFLPVVDGTFTLNGKQALSYSRIRYVGNADFDRTQRQRTVITQMMSRMKRINPAEFNAGMVKALNYIGSDMSVTDMYALSLKLPFILAAYKPEQLRIPEDNTWSYGETWDGMSIINVDFYANTEILKNRIYLPDAKPAKNEEYTEE